MTSDERKWADRWVEAQRKPWNFIRDFVCTLDQHDMTEIANKKPAPKKAYLRAVCRAWDELDVMLLEKSRQIWMTWLFGALFLWLAMKPAKLVFDQSKKQDDANAVLQRQRHIYKRLLLWKKVLPGLPIAKMTGAKVGTDSVIEFPEIDSKIWAIPQGPEIVASYTISGLFADEMDLQPQWLDGFSRAMPAISGGGKYTGIGSANGKTPAWRLLYDIADRKNVPRADFALDSDRCRDLLLRPPNSLGLEEKRMWIERELLNLSDEEFDGMSLEKLFAHLPGMRFWETDDGNNSMRVHYTADPEKDPKTQNGKVWLREEKKRFKYNSNRAKWDREMEIKRSTYEGRPVIGNWDPDFFIPKNPDDYDYDDREILHIGIDFGVTQCGGLFAQLIRIPRTKYHQLRFIDEIVLRDSNTPELAVTLKDKLRTEYGPSWRNARYELYVDPAGNQTKETTSDRSQRSSILIFESSGFSVTDRKLGLTESTEFLETIFMTTFEVSDEDGKIHVIPAVTIHPRCVKLIEACEGGLHYPESGGVEGHYEKDGEYDHIGDEARYLTSNVIDEDMLAVIPEEEYRWKYYKTRQKGTGRVLSVQKVRVA